MQWRQGLHSLALATTLATVSSCSEQPKVESAMADKTNAAAKSVDTPARVETATLGAGCFWCVEAVFQELEGVVAVASGYTGGSVDNPTYEQVCSGRTGHAEVAQIQFDPAKVSFEKVLEVFFQTHDPTTLDRQGNDSGTQYRSAIFTHDDRQFEIATRIKQELDASGAWDDPIVTEITPLGKFWKAEDYHQNYYRDNPNQGYCRFVIAPKLDKFRKVFKNDLKKPAS
jgi:peptide-methionine (S)-S-oxide reductase